VHNVFLSHGAELGIVGSVLWLCGLLGAVGGAILRRGPPELFAWRLGLVAVFVAFLVVAMLGPLSYPFPNLLLWIWAGVAGAPYFLRPPDEAPSDLDSQPAPAATTTPVGSTR
jgi:O-antigen ligase